MTFLFYIHLLFLFSLHLALHSGDEFIKPRDIFHVDRRNATWWTIRRRGSGDDGWYTFGMRWFLVRRRFGIHMVDGYHGGYRSIGTVGRRTFQRGGGRAPPYAKRRMTRRRGSDIDASPNENGWNDALDQDATYE